MSRNAITTPILISIISNEYNTTNSIVIAELIEQLFMREVHIDFIDYVLCKLEYEKKLHTRS